MVGKPSKFRFGTSCTRSHEQPRGSIGTGTTDRVSSSTRLNYCNGSVEEHSKQRGIIQTSNGRWLKPVIHAAAQDHGEDTSKKVDEYLEFLDKRYSRMRGNEASHPRRALSIMKWLRAEDHHDTEEKDSNALYDLGVAGLASKRLLQRQGVTLRKCTIIQPSFDPPSIFVEHTSEETPTEGLSLLLNKILAAFSAKLILLQRQVSMRREWALRSLSRQTMVSTKAALTSLPRATANLARTVVRAGGGERNLKVAVAFTFAFAICIVQPLAKSAITARTQV